MAKLLFWSASSEYGRGEFDGITLKEAISMLQKDNNIDFDTDVFVYNINDIKDMWDLVCDFNDEMLDGMWCEVFKR